MVLVALAAVAAWKVHELQQTNNEILAREVRGMVIDQETRRPALGAGGGGYSGIPIHAVAVRTVFDVHAALPDLPLIGVGGVVDGWTAVELLLAGACAVQIGTVNFVDPRAPAQVLRGLQEWCEQRGVTSITDLIGKAH